MLVAYRLAGLSALEAHYAGVSALTQSGESFSDAILRLAASERPVTNESQTRPVTAIASATLRTNAAEPPSVV
jgi:hypothetical protein